MRTSIILVAVVTAVLGGTLIASAQVSSGSTEAAQQNFAKKSTDKPAQNDQQNATANRRQEVPRGADETDGGVHALAIDSAL